MYFIVAADQNNIIGKNGSIPWHVPEDMSFFRNMTLTHIVIMGRKTFESLSSPLSNRITIVITNRQNYTDTDTLYYRNMNTVFELLDQLKKKYPEKKQFVCGGNEIYTLFFPWADEIYFTKITRKETDGDTYFSKEILDTMQNPTKYCMLGIISDTVSCNSEYRYKFFSYRKLMDTELMDTNL